MNPLELFGFSLDELRELARCLAQVHGPGYSSDKTVAQLQVKISMRIEAKEREAENREIVS